VPAFAQAFEEFARFVKLLGPRTLREIAADDDEVGLQLVNLPVDRLDKPLVMSAEVKVGKMDYASHGVLENAVPAAGFRS
jgi:hypothetical protein